VKIIAKITLVKTIAQITLVKIIARITLVNIICSNHPGQNYLLESPW